MARRLLGATILAAVGLFGAVHGSMAATHGAQPSRVSGAGVIWGSTPGHNGIIWGSGPTASGVIWGS